MAVIEAERIKDSAICEVGSNALAMKVELQETDVKVSALTAEKEASMGGEIKTLQPQVDALAHDLVKGTSVLNNEEDTLRNEKKKYISL